MSDTNIYEGPHGRVWRHDGQIALSTNTPMSLAADLADALEAMQRRAEAAEADMAAMDSVARTAKRCSADVHDKMVCRMIATRETLEQLRGYLRMTHQASPTDEGADMLAKIDDCLYGMAGWEMARELDTFLVRAAKDEQEIARLTAENNRLKRELAEEARRRRGPMGPAHDRLRELEGAD